MSQRPDRSLADGGFSIVEALVALAVFALAGVGLVQLQAHSLRTLADVEQHTLAGVVAQNQLVVIAAARQPPDFGAREGEAELGGRNWRWRLVVAPTPEAGARRVSIEVSEPARESDAVRAHMYVFAPAEAGP